MMQPVQSYSRSAITAPEKIRPASPPETSISAPAIAAANVRPSGASARTFTVGHPTKQRTVEEKLFFALADAKIWTSLVSRHLDRDSQKRIFLQLDVLHEAEEWAEGDNPVDIESYKSFVRAIIYHKINSRPSLSLMPNGNILALWNKNEDKLTVEFLAKNRTRWLVQNSTDSGPERATGTSPLERLRDVLQPYGAERWFDGC